MPERTSDIGRFDAIIVGAGLAAARELTDAGKRVAVLDQENAANLGGQRSGRSG